MSNLAIAFQKVSSLSPEQKQVYLLKYEQGVLTEMEKEELAEHLVRAALALQYEDAVEKFLS